MTREIVIRIQIPDGVATPDIDYGDDLPPEPPHLMAPPPPAYDPDAVVRPVASPAPGCPIHGAMTRHPAGISKKTNKPFNARWSCDVTGCDTKPIWDKDAA